MDNLKFSKYSPYIDILELLNRGNYNLATKMLSEVDGNDYYIGLLNNGVSPDVIKKSLRDFLESKISFFDVAEDKANMKINAEAQNRWDRLSKIFQRGDRGQFSVNLKSPFLMPGYNQKSLTETTGSSLISQETRPELMEIPNQIPTLQKVNVTFNFVDGPAGEQAIPTVITNAPIADIKDNVVVGELIDPEFSLCEGKVKLITSQLPLSRRFFVQSGNAANEMLKAMMYNVIMDAIFYRMIYGDGDSQCLGLYNNTNVEKVPSASFDEEKGYTLIKKVESNEVPFENCMWIINSETEKLLKKRSYGTGDRRVIEKGLFLDKPYALSERILDKQVWYGAFQSVVITLFNLDVLLDPFSSGGYGVIIKYWQPYSMDVRHPGWVVCGTEVD